ncbi:hypothetical protein B0H17DRAFT_1206917 [Mycena rosella]|uniref:Uncharacterized protein n=1 Tax=Mycena rosella TaxID=1033263 RepID=A0AAD7D4C5_MYCRO|nr:hypothetical protein B0H17DRAFT_1206917 [Mycena rosella]
MPRKLRAATSIEQKRKVPDLLEGIAPEPPTQDLSIGRTYGEGPEREWALGSKPQPAVRPLDLGEWDKLFDTLHEVAHTKLCTGVDETDAMYAGVTYEISERSWIDERDAWKESHKFLGRRGMEAGLRQALTFGPMPWSSSVGAQKHRKIPLFGPEASEASEEVKSEVKREESD